MNWKKALFELSIVVVMGLMVTLLITTAARIYVASPAFKTPEPMTLEETQKFFSTFKLETGQ